MALNPATHAVFVASTGASGSVVVIDGVHDQIATTIGALPVGATSISVAPQTNVALVTFEASNALSVIDAANNYAVTTTMPVGGVGIQLGCPFDFPAPLSQRMIPPARCFTCLWEALCILATIRLGFFSTISGASTPVVRMFHRAGIPPVLLTRLPSIQAPG